MARQATSLYSVSTSLSADSVESHPFIEGLFALGTYQVDQHEIKENLKSKDPDPERQIVQEKGQDGIEEKVQNLDLKEEDVDASDDRDEEGTTSPAYSRRGRMTLRKVRRLEEKDRVDCEILQSVETPAILDMKWSLCRPNSSTTESLGVLGIAQASGDLALSSLSFTSSTSNEPTLISFASLRMNPKKALCLSLDWADRTGGNLGGYPSWRSSDRETNTFVKDTSLIVSQSDGSLAYLPSLSTALNFSDISPRTDSRPSSLDEARQDEDEEYDSEEEERKERIEAHSALNTNWDNKPKGLETWKAHDFEAWIAAFDCWSDGSVIWSGGDDLKLKGWDVRSSNSSQGREPTFVHSKSFDGGVTTLQSHHLRQHLWAVGSYDSNLRLFDSRNTLRPLSTTHVGGGIWRIKWHPTNPSQILLGCMHDGFKILNLDSLSQAEDASSYSKEEMEIVTRFDEHESLAYGCDWDRGDLGEGEREGRHVISCSFYDALLHIWQS